MRPLSFQNQILKGDAFESYGLLTPSFTAPGVAAEPVLWVPAAVLVPEVLASPPGEGLLLAPVVPLFMVPVSFFIVPCGAPGPTLPWLDAPSLGWARRTDVARNGLQAK